MLEASLGGDVRDDDEGAYGWVASDLRTLHDRDGCIACVVLLVGSDSNLESPAIFRFKALLVGDVHSCEPGVIGEPKAGYIKFCVLSSRMLFLSDGRY